MLRKLLSGIEAGLIAGTLTGIAEALAVLSFAASTSDYVALFYAAVLYGLVGAGLGVALGLALALWDRVRPLSEPTAFTLGFVGTLAPMGVGVAHFHTERLLEGVTATAALIITGVTGIVGLFGLFIGPILLSRTPLKVMMRPKGTAAAWLSLAGLTAIFSFAPGGPGGEGELAPVRTPDPDSPGPNILLIVVDALRADRLSAYGYPTPTSPALDGLAADSVLFEQAHAHAPWTRPAFASLLCGMVPTSHGVTTRASILPDAAQTLAELLNGAGYVTGGLPNSAEVTRRYNFQQGFDYFHYMKPELPLWGTESVVQLAVYAVLRDAIERRERHALTDYYQPAQAVVAHGQQFIEAQGQNRWFLLMHFMEPHDPLIQRPFNGRMVARTDAVANPQAMGAMYDDSIRAMDAELAMLLDWLRSTGRYDDMVIVVTADHGAELLDHGGYWSGGTLFEEQLRVPLVIKRSGQHLAGTRAAWTVRQIDIAPTLSRLAGLPPDPTWQGADLFDEAGEGALQVLADASGAEPAEDPPPRPEIAALNRTVLAELDADGETMTAVISDGFKLIRAGETNPRGLPTESLYALALDPRETRNLAGSDIARQAALAAVLGRELQAASDRALAGPSAQSAEQVRALGYGR